MYGPIIFSAYSDNSGYFHAGDYITNFTNILTNVGDSFTLSDGIFKASRNGIYEFSASAYHRNPGENRLVVLKNDAKVVKFQDWYIRGDGGDWDWTLTFNWIMELQKGDQVRLQVELGAFWCHSEGYCIFNGKFLKNV